MITEDKLEKEKLESTEEKNLSEDQNTQNDETVVEESSNSVKMAELEEELVQLKDKYIRQVAEFDNYRKRTLKEKTELILNGGEKVLKALLPVLDDLDRALENIEKCEDVENLKEGVHLIIDKLSKTLNNQGLQQMEVIGKYFDTDFHEAIAMIPATQEAQKNRIIDCVQPGYILNEKVIRHAKVVVGQ